MAHTNGTTGALHPECCLLDSNSMSTTTGVSDGEKIAQDHGEHPFGGGMRPW